MNAKINITVPINKLHFKVSDMLEEVAKELENALIDATAISKAVKLEQDFLSQLENLDSLRKKMTLLDANLEDCYSVINGLVSYKANKLKVINQEEQKDAVE